MLTFIVEGQILFRGCMVDEFYPVAYQESGRGGGGIINGSDLILALKFSIKACDLFPWGGGGLGSKSPHPLITSLVFIDF